MYVSTCLLCVCVCVFVYTCVDRFIMCVCVPCTGVYMCTCVYMNVCLSVCPSVRPSFVRPSVRLSACLPACLSTCLPAYPSVRVFSLYLSVCMCCVCVCVVCVFKQSSRSLTYQYGLLHSCCLISHWDYLQDHAEHWSASLLAKSRPIT